MDGNTLLAWCVIMGGRVEEETFWADDKSYVEFISSFCVLKTMFTNDLVGAILSLLSQAISDAIATASTDQWDSLYNVLGHLAQWKERPGCLTTMAYQGIPVIIGYLRVHSKSRLNSSRPQGLLHPHSIRFEELVGRIDRRGGVSKRE